MRPRPDDGSATIWVLSLTVVVAALAAAALALMEVRVVRERAVTAADLAALAAAAVLPLVDEGCAQAARVAEAQGVRLTGCSSDGSRVDVEVTGPLPGPLGTLGVVRARSRAGPPPAP